jgi:hypothetical protein
MNATLLCTGLACVIAAVVGGGLKAFGVEIPILTSLKRQLVLGILGAILIGVALHTSAVPDTIPQQPAVEPNPQTNPPRQRSEATAPNNPKVERPQEPHSSGASVSGYWSGTPEGMPLPVVLHLIQNGVQVTGTMQSPCQSQYATSIDSGSIDKNRLSILVSQLGVDSQGVAFPPVRFNIALKNGQLNGSFAQGSYDRHITLHRGEEECSH